MRTVVIFQEDYEGSYFFILEGDYRHLNRVFLNNKGDADEEELSNLMAMPNGDSMLIDMLGEFPTQAVVEGACVIMCGICP